MRTVEPQPLPVPLGLEHLRLTRARVLVDGDGRAGAPHFGSEHGLSHQLRERPRALRNERLQRRRVELALHGLELALQPLAVRRRDGRLELPDVTARACHVDARRRHLELEQILRPQFDPFL